MTIIFIDVVRSTSLGEALDPETLRGMMSRFFTEMRIVLERYGGTVEKFIGDAIMAVFGLPTLHEDDALRATRAAVEMRTALATMNKELERDYGLTIEVRTGINTGEVVSGDRSSREALVTGDAVNVAARLQQFAKPGEVLLGDDTYRLIRHEVDTQALGPLKLKGKGDATPAYRLVGLTTNLRGEEHYLDSPLVGRESEMALLKWAYDRASQERTPHLLTLLGVAGIGKSRLVTEFLHSVRGEATVLVGHCLPYGEGITFWPLREIVAQAVGLSEVDSSDDVASRIAALLEGNDDAPLVAQRVAQAIAAIEATNTNDEIFWGVRKLLEALAERRPLVVILEDIHWAETTFLDLIEHVVDWSREVGILLLCVARPELLENRPGWAGGKPNSSAVLIESFDSKTCALLINNLLGPDNLPAAIKTQILDASGGNPLFVEEMIAMLIDDGLLAQETGHWRVTTDFSSVPVPPSIQALLAARLDRLVEEERAVLQRAAVVGEEFYKGAVTELMPSHQRAGTSDYLSALMRRGFIRPQSSTFAGHETYRFHHILIRDAAYDALPKQLRAELHEQFASWLERAAAGRSSEYEEILGYHFERAYWFKIELGANGNATQLQRRAVNMLVSASRRARALGDASAAVNLLSRATAILDAQDPSRIELLSDLAASLMEVGKWDIASRAFDEALAAARELGDKRIEARTAIDRWDFQVSVNPERHQEMRLEVEQLMAVLTDFGDDVGLAKAWGLIALERWCVCRYAEAGQAFARASNFAGRSKAAELEARLLAGLVDMVVWGPTPVPEAIEQCREILPRAKQSKYAEWTVRSGLNLLYAMQGHVAEARSALVPMKDYFEDRGHDWGVAKACQQVGLIEMLARDWEGAEREFSHLLEILERHGDKSHLSTAAGYLARALCAQQRFYDALPYTEVSESSGGSADVQTQVLWRCTRARVRAHQGRLEEAETLAQGAVAISGTSDALNDQADALLDLAEVLLTSGKRDQSFAARRNAVELFERKGNIVAAAAARTRQDEVRID